MSARQCEAGAWSTREPVRPLAGAERLATDLRHSVLRREADHRAWGAEADAGPEVESVLRQRKTRGGEGLRSVVDRDLHRVAVDHNGARRQCGGVCRSDEVTNRARDGA